jgi:hypothetical protein
MVDSVGYENKKMNRWTSHRSTGPNNLRGNISNIEPVEQVTGPPLYFYLEVEPKTN